MKTTIESLYSFLQVFGIILCIGNGITLFTLGWDTMIAIGCVLGLVVSAVSKHMKAEYIAEQEEE